MVSEMRTMNRESISVGRLFLRHVAEGERWRRDLIQAIHGSTRPTGARVAENTVPVSGEHAKTMQNLILQNMRFREMTDRERRIPKAHGQTFTWIYEDPRTTSKSWASFKDFLQLPDQKLYWITGKPGSGKSTLMKYIRNNDATLDSLRAWAPDEDVILANFYFWNSGSEMQMTIEGLLRAVLYDCLRQLPSQIPHVLPERWEAFRLMGDDDYPWEWEELSEALRRLILDVCRNRKFFFMIDGLDECSGELSQLTDLILATTVSADNLKVCAASRPWTNFEDAFQGRPHLMLQDLTRADIDRFVSAKFTESEGFHELQVREPLYAERLLSEVSSKAQGVFLWVHLVVNSLLSGMANGDRIADLRRRLDALPPDLEALFEKMLDSLDENYLSHASQLFQLLRASRISPSIFSLALADLDDRERVLRDQVVPFTKDEQEIYCKNMKRKLMSRCRGLLEANLISEEKEPSRRTEASSQEGLTSECPDTDENTYVDPEGGDPDLDEERDSYYVQICDLKVQYLHRTVKDYVESSEVWDRIVSANKEPFDPNLRWCESYLTKIKKRHPNSMSLRGFWGDVTWCIHHASRVGPESQVDVKRLLDELDRASSALTQEPRTGGGSFLSRFGHSEDGSSSHWVGTLITWVPDVSFNYLMVMCGMDDFLSCRLRHRSRSRRHDGPPTVPYLLAATSDFDVLDQFEKRDGITTSTPRLTTIKLLLKKGEDPYEIFNGRSIYSFAQGMADRDEPGFAEVLSLYKRYGGPAPETKHPKKHSGRLRQPHEDDKSQRSESNASSATTPITFENLSKVPMDFAEYRTETVRGVFEEAQFYGRAKPPREVTYTKKKRPKPKPTSLCIVM